MDLDLIRNINNDVINVNKRNNDDNYYHNYVSTQIIILNKVDKQEISMVITALITELKNYFKVYIIFKLKIFRFQE